jgi:fucose permease
VLPLACASFGIFGVLLVLVGTYQAPLAAALDLDLAQTGALAAAGAAGSAVGTLGTGPVADRASRRALWLAGCILGAGAGMLAAGLGSMAQTAAGLAGLGAAAGALQTVSNASLADRYGARAARPIAAAHLGVTVGAFVGPGLLLLLARPAGVAGGFRAVAAAYALLAVGAALVPESHRQGTRERGATRPPWSVIAPFAAMAVCYVGFETSLTTFATPWAASVGLAQARGPRAITAFWLGLLVGRAALLARGTPPGPALLAALSLGATAILAAALALETTRLEWALVAIGLCCGAVFPLLIALATLAAPGASGTAAGAVAAAGGIGGMTGPWLTGLLADTIGARGALTHLLAWSAAVGLLAVWIARRPRGTRADPC